jgi:P27 family predicted phage terminase small subunit
LGRRGPPREPVELRILRGNPSRRPVPPSLRIVPPPEPPEPPEFLTGHAAEEWRRIAPELHALRCLTPFDIGPLAAYCDAYKRWRTAVETISGMEAQDPQFRGLLVKGPDGNAAVNPLVKIADRAAQRMVRFAGEFGMTPSARARVAAGPFSGRSDGPPWRA